MFPAKKSSELKAKVLEAAAGSSGRRNPEKRPVVEFSADGTSSKAGPAASSYEKSRAAAGCHLVFNAFWLASTFCLSQMYMRDSLHQIDHGVFIHILRAILRLFLGMLT